MQKKSSKPALETPQSPQPSVFQRARNRLLVGLGAGAKPPSPAPATGPESLLERFYSLQGVAKTAFFRANREARKAAEVAAPPSSAAAHKASPASGCKPPSPSPATGPESLLERFHSLQGGAKTAFFRANREALKAAEVAVPPSSAAAHKASPAPGCKPPSPSPATGPESLLERFYSLQGTAKTAFFRANYAALKLAA